ncbi:MULTISPECIES: hypothetical protein [Fusobacterium]|uniref:HEAT repeat domain-containing protein n=1 Tax=Fusobacterium nucleatum TaxID=851 RepID=A0A323TV85_FUSNU|nr:MULTISPECIES: hypothetical protein [Fusobacterium]PCR84097.1 hypothetical protein CQA79_11690 [Fusobacterium nucleatum]PZA03637.1 hypothetical protein DNF10_10935 [Fusobacterium nucleatum]QJX51175.1 hypothetical protein HOO60_09855 [Fusobacterium nucleatum]HCE32755.1 hypothetical protein [Fusobacterium sp.]
MNFETLYELKNRLENVAVVGINLVKDDFRLKRAVEQVKEYSTVAKVFKQIYDMGSSLISTDDEDKCDLFLDLLALLDAVLCTQTTTYSGDKPQQIKTIAKNKDYYKELHYSELSPLLYALTETGSGRCEIIENIIENNSKLLNDFRVKNYMIHGLSDKYSEISYIITEELKKQGKEVIPLLKDGFDPQGKRDMVLRFDIISTLCKEEENDFYKYCIENGSKEIKEIAIEALKYSQDNIDYILDLTKTEKGRLKNKAFEALSYMNDDRAEKEWDKFFKKKPFENILYLQNTNQQWAIDYLTNYIEEYVKELKKEDKKKEVGVEVSSLCMMTFKRRTNKLLSLYKELYPYNRYEIKRILSYYIVSEVDKEIIDLVKELSEKYEGEFLEQEFLISLIKDKPETVYKNFSKYIGVGKSQKEIKDLFSNFFLGKHSKTKESARIQEDFRTVFNIIFHIEYKEESKEYILYWQNIDDYSVMEVKLSGFDKKWYDIIFELDNDYYENWNSYSSYNSSIKRLYNPDIKGMKEKYGKFYYNIILSRIPYGYDIEFLNKLEWTDYKDFLKGKIDIEKNPSAFANRVRYVGYILQDTLMSESDLIEQLEEIMAINKKNPKVPINLCDRWLERLKSGVKVKEL